METQDFLELYNQGLSDTKISSILNIERHKIGKFRKNLNLPRTSLITPHKEKIRELVSLGLSDLKISKILSISKSSVQLTRKSMNLKTNFIQRIYENKLDRRKGYILRNIKFSAKSRNLQFNLNYKDIELPKFCPILGLKLSYGTDKNGLNNASIDRIDNSKGYIKGNVIVMSRLANLMKNKASLEQLNLFAENISKLTNYYKNHGALGSITDVFPDTEMYEET